MTRKSDFNNDELKCYIEVAREKVNIITYNERIIIILRRKKNFKLS